MPHLQGDLRRPAAGTTGRRRPGVGRLNRAASPLARPHRATTAGIVTLVTLIAFEAMAVSTAMPVVATDLDAVREYGLAFSLFFVALLLGVVVCGAWADARGPAGPVVAGMLLFSGGLVVSGVAGSLGVFLLGRVLAGAGGGLAVVAVYVVIAAVFPTSLQPQVFSFLSAGWVLPAIAGPALAGWLAESVGWRAVFLLVPPITVLPALVLVPRLRRLPPPDATEAARSTDDAARRVLAGIALVAAVGLVLWALDRISRQDGGSLSQPAFAAAIALGSVAALGALRPLLPPGALRLARGLPSVVVLRGCFAATFFGVESFIPLMLVTQRGFSPTAAGLVLTAGAFGWTAGAFLQARPWMRLPRYVLLSAGGLILAAGQAALVLTIDPSVPAWVAVPMWAFTAFGMGIGMSSTSVLTLRLSRSGEEGRNSSGLQLSDSLGSTLGIGLTGAAFAAWHSPGGDDGPLFAGMWLACATVAAATSVIGLRARG